MSAAASTQLFTNLAGTVLAHPAGYALVRYHGGRWSTPDLATLLTQLGQLLQQRGWHYVLTDARLMPPLSTESKAWLEQNWLGPQARRPQPLYMALLQPAEVVARLAVAQMQAQNHGSTFYTYFDDEDKAHGWLQQQVGPASS